MKKKCKKRLFSNGLFFFSLQYQLLIINQIYLYIANGVPCAQPNSLRFWLVLLNKWESTFLFPSVSSHLLSISLKLFKNVFLIFCSNKPPQSFLTGSFINVSIFNVQLRANSKNLDLPQAAWSYYCGLESLLLYRIYSVLFLQVV